MPELEVPAAQNPSVDAVNTPSPQGDSPAATDASEEQARLEAQQKADRDRRAQEGRERQEAARRQQEQLSATLAAQGAQIQQLTAQLNHLVGGITAERQAKEDAIIASLPPEMQALKKIERLEKQIADATAARTAVPQAQPATTQQQQTRRLTQDEQAALDNMRRQAQTLVDQAIGRHGVQISLDEVPDHAWQSRDAFAKFVDDLGRERAAISAARENGGTPVAKQDSGNSEMDALRKEIADLRRSLGVSRPNSATPVASSKPGAVTEDTFSSINQTRVGNSRQGMVQIKEQTRAARDRAREQAQTALTGNQ